MEQGQRSLEARRVCVWTGGDSELAPLMRQSGAAPAVTVLPLCAESSVDSLDDVDVCILDGPLADGGSAIRALLGRRTPFLVSCSAGLDLASLARLSRAAAKRKVPTGMLGTLRLAPAVSRIREMISAGVLGTVESVRVCRTVAPAGQQSEEERIERFRDVDVLCWLHGGGEGGGDIEITERDGVVIATSGGAASDGPCGGPGGGAGVRSVHVRGTGGVIECTFHSGFLYGDSSLATLFITLGCGNREVCVPAGRPVRSELAVVLGLAPLRLGWPCLPPLSACVFPWERVCFF